MNRYSIIMGLLLAFTLTARAQQHIWHAEYDASDDIGDYWGERQGGVTFAPGVQGMAFSFDGTDDLIRLSRAPLLPPWTLTAWVRRSDAAGTWQAVPGFSDIAGQNQTVTFQDEPAGRSFYRGVVWLQ